ncbi:hypothetical protein AB2B38_005190 [Balneola sp. MJW-20]|uniref:hypothetical protein n=1 Tax=Gracilimonas aurantiaca TaxID=3234185 RepID=UPI00346715C3
MKIFRSHIIRYWSALLLIAGIFLHIGSATNEELRTDVFTKWLEWQLDNSDEALKAELADLGYDGEEISDAIKQASVLIQSGEHQSDDAEPSDSDRKIYRILIQQWNEFNDQNQGMGKAIVFEQQKPSAIQHNDGYVSASKALTYKHPDTESPEIKSIAYSELPSSHTLIPMIGGTAIGAP